MPAGGRARGFDSGGLVLGQRAQAARYFTTTSISTFTSCATALILALPFLTD